MKRRMILPIACLAFLAAATLQISSVFASDDDAWGPQNRPTYTWDHPADHATFNSMTNNPVLGDERNFVRIREANTEDKYLDEVTLEVGKEYEVYIFYHNNAAANLNESGKGLATGVRLSTAFTTSLDPGTAGTVKATLLTPDADPTSVYDTAYMRANDKVYLRYVPNSAVIHNDGTANGTILAPDALFSDTGAAIGFSSSYWGVIPGCNEYAGYITYRFKVDKPDFEVNKEVSIKGKNDWTKEITAKPGDTVDFKITYKNTGTTAQTTVTAHDWMPNGLSYVSGSTFAKSTADSEGKAGPDTLFGDGLGLGTFQAGEFAIVTYSAKLADDETIFPCGNTAIYNNASVATPNGSQDSNVKINVVRNCAQPKLPTTGPAEVAMALTVVVIIGGGSIYFFQSQRMLRKVASTSGGAGANPTTPIEPSVPEDTNSNDVASDNISNVTDNPTIDDIAQDNAEPPVANNPDVNPTDISVNDDIVRDSIQNSSKDTE